jgi:hypothetical protein
MPADLKLWLTAAPNALISGRVDANAQVVGDKTGYGLTSGEEDTIADKVWDEDRSGHRASGSFGQMLQSPNDGTAQAGAAGSITLASGASSVDDFYKDALLFIINGTGQRQVRRVSAYNGTTKVASVAPNWKTTPDATSVYVVLPAVQWGNPAGPGALQRTLGITVGGSPLEGASVWVATDAVGNNIVAGPLTTTSMGIVTLLLDAGSFYAWAQKDGYNPVAGQAITVA